MGDAILSIPVGASFWAAAALTVGVSARRLQRGSPDRLTPLMGVMGAFVFAAQMINFAIIGTGSSGHLGGGLLLAILLGPHAGFLVMVSILAVQASLFADGGLLALGCNIVNMGLIPCYIAYPLVYRPLAGGEAASRWRPNAAAITAAIVALELGALAVVLQTWLSDISSLSLHTFAILMLGVHLPIGLVEGIATAGILQAAALRRPLKGITPQTAPGAPVIGFMIAALLLAGGVSWFASSRPDGLEWSIEHASTSTNVTAAPSGRLEAIQRQIARLPDYEIPSQPDDERSPAQDYAGSSAAGLIGALATLAVAGFAAWCVRLAGHRRSKTGG